MNLRHVVPFQYLDKKRIHFPRFFFISNDELLEILSETKDPLRIQIYLTKCFSGIAYLNFTETFSIKSIQSAEVPTLFIYPIRTHKLTFNFFQTEVIPLCNTVVTANARGQVEKWLLELETEMHNTIMDSIKTTLSLAQHDWNGFVERILEYPGQILHCCLSLIWTQQVTELITSSGTLKEFIEQEEVAFETLLKKSLEPNMESKDRLNLNGLLVLKLHHIEVTKHLQESNVTSLDSFPWISQLRHEYVEDNLTVRTMSNVLEYGFEYLGNVKRLILTPQTERCYRTLFLALNYHLGGHITGPAGAGKSELVKDFAKCLAKYLIIFNCSEETPKSVLGSFFKVNHSILVMHNFQS